MKIIKAKDKARAVSRYSIVSSNSNSISSMSQGEMGKAFYLFPPCSSLLCSLSSVSVLNFSSHKSHLNFFLLKKSNLILPV
jgi:hypothetical protein